MGANAGQFASAHQDFKANTGWLNGFKNRNNIFKAMFCESGAVNI